MKILVFCIYCDQPLEFSSEYTEELDLLEISVDDCCCQEMEVTLH